MGLLNKELVKGLLGNLGADIEDKFRIAGLGVEI